MGVDLGGGSGSGGAGKLAQQLRWLWRRWTRLCGGADTARARARGGTGSGGTGRLARRLGQWRLAAALELWRSRWRCSGLGRNTAKSARWMNKGPRRRTVIWGPPRSRKRNRERNRVSQVFY